tara:strand:+ start:25 stop:711 length:687 start_codon:yes stop_codon:yes gene_type:complete
MTFICIIQSRTNSVRLPGKCFLPLAGMPLVELCARRSQTKFAKTWIAISDCPSDDLLAKRLEMAKLSFYRGSSDNVLERFYSLCKYQKVKEDDVVIRLTGDNPLVDCIFLEKMKKIWEENDLDYLTGEPPDLKDYAWPKGLSAEFFRARSLYQAKNSTVNKFDLEHVTPFIRHNARKSACMADLKKLKYPSKKNFSIDRLNDYLYVAKIFDQIKWNESYESILRLVSE